MYKNRFILECRVCLCVLPNKPVTFFLCSAHVREALCKHLQASCFTAPFEISCARKAAKLDNTDAAGDLVSVLPPPLRSMFSEVLVLPLFFLSPPVVLLYELSGGKQQSFFCWCYCFIRQQGQPTSNPIAVALRIIQVQLNKYIQCIFEKEACGSHKAFPVPLRQTWRHFLYGCFQMWKHLDEQI